MNQEQFDLYIERMDKSMRDKIFFLDHIPDFDLLVDYGCANGSLIKAVLPYEPKAKFIGFDIDKKMISEARSNVSNENAFFTDNWELVEKEVQNCKGISIVVLNSLLHEIFSYAGPTDQRIFWNRTFRSGFTYISIRDMMMRESHFNKKIADDTLQDVLDRIRQSDHGEEKVDTFQEVFGDIITEGELIHLMMKLDYWNNWEREVHENYLGIFVDDFFKKMNSVGKGLYTVDHWETFTLQYLKNKIKKEFDYDINSPTHIKVLLKSTQN